MLKIDINASVPQLFNLFFSLYLSILMRIRQRFLKRIHFLLAVVNYNDGGHLHNLRFKKWLSDTFFHKIIILFYLASHKHHDSMRNKLRCLGYISFSIIILTLAFVYR